MFFSLLNIFALENKSANIGLFLFNSYTWKVSYPINTYNVSFYLGNFDVVKDNYISGSDTLKTSFYA